MCRDIEDLEGGLYRWWWWWGQSRWTPGYKCQANTLLQIYTLSSVFKKGGMVIGYSQLSLLHQWLALVVTGSKDCGAWGRQILQREFQMGKVVGYSLNPLSYFFQTSFSHHASKA